MDAVDLTFVGLLTIILFILLLVVDFGRRAIRLYLIKPDVKEKADESKDVGTT